MLIEMPLPHPLPQLKGGKNIVRKDACIWNRYFNSFDQDKIKW